MEGSEAAPRVVPRDDSSTTPGPSNCGQPATNPLTNPVQPTRPTALPPSQSLRHRPTGQQADAPSSGAMASVATGVTLGAAAPPPPEAYILSSPAGPQAVIMTAQPTYQNAVNTATNGSVAAAQDEQLLWRVTMIQETPEQRRAERIALAQRQHQKAMQQQLMQQHMQEYSRLFPQTAQQNSIVTQTVRQTNTPNGPQTIIETTTQNGSDSSAALLDQQRDIAAAQRQLLQQMHAQSPEQWQEALRQHQQHMQQYQQRLLEINQQAALRQHELQQAEQQMRQAGLAQLRPNNPEAGMLAAIIPHLWLIVRLMLFVWWFTSPAASWSRWATVIFLAVAMFLINTGMVDGMANQVWAPIRRHLDAIVPVDGPQPQNGQQNVPAAAPNGDAAGGGAPGGAGGPEPDPAAAAARLVAQRRNANADWLMDLVRRAERVGIMFLASLAPGIAERHVALAEQRRQEEEDRRRREEEAAAAAEVAAEMAAEAEAAAAAEKAAETETPAKAAPEISPEGAAAEPAEGGAEEAGEKNAPGGHAAVLAAPAASLGPQEA